MTETHARVFPPQPGDIVRCELHPHPAHKPAREPWFETVDIEGHWRSETYPKVTSVLHRRKAHPDHMKAVPVAMTTGEPRMKFQSGSIVRVFYPTGVQAEARVYTDGTYYGQADVERGDATVELAYEVPEDCYHEWVTQTPHSHLLKLEGAFRMLQEMYGGNRDGLVAANNVIQLLGSYQVHAHFRRWAGLL